MAKKRKKLRGGFDQYFEDGGDTGGGESSGMDTAGDAGLGGIGWGADAVSGMDLAGDQGFGSFGWGSDSIGLSGFDTTVAGDTLGFDTTGGGGPFGGFDTTTAGDTLGFDNTGGNIGGFDVAGPGDTLGFDNTTGGFDLTGMGSDNIGGFDLAGPGDTLGFDNTGGFNLSGMGGQFNADPMDAMLAGFQGMGPYDVNQGFGEPSWDFGPPGTQGGPYADPGPDARGVFQGIYDALQGIPSTILDALGINQAKGADLLDPITDPNALPGINQLPAVEFPGARPGVENVPLAELQAQGRSLEAQLGINDINARAANNYVTENFPTPAQEMPDPQDYVIQDPEIMDPPIAHDISLTLSDRGVTNPNPNNTVAAGFMNTATPNVDLLTQAATYQAPTLSANPFAALDNPNQYVNQSFQEFGPFAPSLQVANDDWGPMDPFAPGEPGMTSFIGGPSWAQTESRTAEDMRGAALDMLAGRTSTQDMDMPTPGWVTALQQQQESFDSRFGPWEAPAPAGPAPGWDPGQMTQGVAGPGNWGGAPGALPSGRGTETTGNWVGPIMDAASRSGPAYETPGWSPGWQTAPQQEQPDIPLPAPNPLSPFERGIDIPMPTPNPLSLSDRSAPGRSFDTPTRGFAGPNVISPSRGAERGPLTTPTVQSRSMFESRSMNPYASRGMNPFAPAMQPNNPQSMLPAGLQSNQLAQALVGRGFNPDLVAAALTINDGGRALSGMLAQAGFANPTGMAAAARGEVASSLGLPSSRRAEGGIVPRMQGGGVAMSSGVPVGPDGLPIPQEAPPVDPSTWSGPPPNYLAGLTAGGFELNPGGLGDTVMDDLGNITINRYNNAQSLQHIQQGQEGFDTSRFRDPRVEAWYAAHPNNAGMDGVLASTQAMLAAIPDAGFGSPLGGWLAAGPEQYKQWVANEAVNPGPFYSNDPTTGLPSPPPPATDEQRRLVGRRLPPVYTAGAELPTFNNYYLLPPGFQDSDYSMRNGRLISAMQRSQDIRGGEGRIPFGMGPGADYPFGFKNLSGVAYPVISLGWPGQLNYPWYVYDPKVT